MCGDMSVGKTCLVTKYVLGIFPKDSLPTIGTDLKTKTLKLKNGIGVKAQIWDTAGQEKYKSIVTK
jgi:small GTP-binding protein